jgi:glycolate oxidase
MTTHPVMSYSPVSGELIASLRRELGADCVHLDDDTLSLCASDETEDLVFRPEVVVEPRDTSRVCAVMRLASSHRVPVTPRGAGTGLSGGALPVHGGIVLSTRHLNRIVEIDTTNLMAVVEPAVITQVFQEAVEAAGLFYPPDPASRGSCFLGGNLAECSGGPRAVKYGVTKDWVTGIEAVLPGGEVIRHGGKLLKNVTGYNLTQLLIGSEGTLGIITRIWFRLLPMPRHRMLLLIPFDTLEASARTVPAVMHAGITPSALEFMERDAIQMAERHLGKPFPNSLAAAQLLIELDGNDEGSIQRDAERVSEIALAQGATDVLAADTPTRMGELWALRRSLGVAVKSESIYKEEDTVVPRGNLVALLVGVKKIASCYGIRTVCYGHAGDGNLHVNILKMAMSDAEWKDGLEPMIREIFELTVSLGGMISGEHGIGFVQRNYLPIALSAGEIDVMRAVKNAIDPLGILNPGKIFPASSGQ